MPIRFLAESGPQGMGLELVLGEPHDLAGLELDGMEPEAARLGAELAPSLVAGAQAEELARRVPVSVEIDVESRLLGAGQSSGKAAGAVEEIVEVGRKLRVVCDLGRKLRPHIACVAQAGTWVSSSSDA
jgi:hypothetical protein